jgi:hypothetical protein
MIIEKRDGGLWTDIFWDDLSAEARAELITLMGGNGNFDVFPIASINVSPEEDSATPYISAKALEHGWLDGFIDDYRFQAKVYDEGSKFGINSGRVSKLEVWDSSEHIVSYDRGWGIKPDSDEQQLLLRELLDYLEELPAEEHRKGALR